MISMSSQRKRFNIVISDLSLCNAIDSKAGIFQLLSTLSNYGITYFAIIHDKDIDIQGLLKRSHLHIVVLLESIKRAKQILNIMCDLFITNSENVQLQECLSPISSVQYLTHKNNQEKYQYFYDDIMTNNYDLLTQMYGSKVVDTIITAEMLFDMVDDNLSIREIISIIGLSNYQTYRQVIKDLML